MTARSLPLLLLLWAPGCATRGHIATPGDIALLRDAAGLSASGKITLSGPGGRFSTRVVFGVSRPDSLRLEIPDGAGLRFLLISKDGALRADLPREDAMFEGAATREVMNRLFGIDLEPAVLVGAILGSPAEGYEVSWRFDPAGPAQVTIRGLNHTRLTLTLDRPSIEAPPEKAFDFGAPRRLSLTVDELAHRLGLRR